MTDRAEYVAAFLVAARPAIVGDVADWGAAVESIDVEHQADRVYVTTSLVFRGHRYRYRRAIWPPDHPAGLKAGLYATMLTERLLTRRVAPTADAVTDL